MIRTATITLLSLAATSAAGDILLDLPIACDLTQTCYIQQGVDHDPGPGAQDYLCGSLSYDGHSKVLRNIPSGEAHESFPKEIRVLDPRHPLYGQSFRVMGRLPFRGGNFLPSYEVEYRQGVTLLVPVAATECHTLPDTLTKLSIEALLDLLNVVDCRDHDEHRTRSSLVDPAADASTTDRRRSCRSSGGGLL